MRHENPHYFANNATFVDTPATAILAMGGFQWAGKLVIKSESLRGATAGKPAAIWHYAARPMRSPASTAVGTFFAATATGGINPPDYICPDRDSPARAARPQLGVRHAAPRQAGDYLIRCPRTL